MSDHTTTSQTVGPFFSLGFERLYRDNLAGPGVSGERIEISGHILDGDGQPVPDGILEFWQANSHGKYAHVDDAQQKTIEQDFTGFARVPTDENGRFHFTTIKPGRVPGPDESLQAPHLVVSVFTRGLLRRLVTRIYFPGEASNAEDFALKLVDPQRRSTLIARNVDGQPGTFAWNVILQGADETVFFDF
jgi:protocatechuate 3,4-dioxygenase alpha subunit